MWSGAGAGDDSGVFAQRYNADGSLNGGEFRVNTTTNGDQRHASVAALADGGFVVPSGPFELRGAPHLRGPYRTFAGRAEAARVWNMVAELTGARFPDPVTPVDETGQANPNTGGSTIATSTAQTA